MDVIWQAWTRWAMMVMFDMWRYPEAARSQQEQQRR